MASHEKFNLLQAMGITSRPLLSGGGGAEVETQLLRQGPQSWFTYAERRGWGVELVSESRGEHGGYREVIARIAGRGVYAALKFESGTHRVQRVPATESQGRIHTST